MFINIEIGCGKTKHKILILYNIYWVYSLYLSNIFQYSSYSKGNEENNTWQTGVELLL